MFASPPVDITIQKTEVADEKNAADGGNDGNNIAAQERARLGRCRSGLNRFRFVAFYKEITRLNMTPFLVKPPSTPYPLYYPF